MTRNGVEKLMGLFVGLCIALFSGHAYSGSGTDIGLKPWDSCYEKSGAKRHIDPELLRGIARFESGERPNAVSPAGAYGLMQIHKSWLPRLAAYGITKDSLFDPCTNIETGTWILENELKRQGNSWEGVGAYNAACTKLKGNECRSQRAWYAWKVYQKMHLVRATSNRTTLQPSIVALEVSP